MRLPTFQLRGKLVLSFSAVVVVLTGALGATIYATFSTSLRSAHVALVHREADAVAGGTIAVVRELESIAVRAALAPSGPGVSAPSQDRAERVAVAVAKAPAVAGVLVLDGQGRAMVRLGHVPDGAARCTEPGFHVVPSGAALLSVELGTPPSPRDAAGLRVALDREALTARAASARGNPRSGLSFRVGHHEIFRVEPHLKSDAATVALGLVSPLPPIEDRNALREEGAALVTSRRLPLMGGRLIYAVPADVLTAELRSLRDRIIVVSFATLCLAIWLVQLVASRISRPLRRLARAAHDMRELDYTTRIEALRATDEIGDLAQAFVALRQEVEASVTKDSLTGVYNRRFLLHTMDLELGRARRARHTTACLMLDLDFFKKINDQVGHLGGDAVLIEMGQILVAAVRATDVVARYGGEEFVVFASPIEEDGVAVLAERIRTAVERASFPVEGATLRCTVSVGAAVCLAGGDTPAALLERADAALYTSKRNGRNCVTIAPRPLRQPATVALAPPPAGDALSRRA